MSEGQSAQLLDLLNQALARELQVCIQYMLQHGVGAGRAAALTGKARPSQPSKFVASHSSVWLPGVTLKKIAIAEMRHAEAITERITLLGAQPITQPAAITLGASSADVLALDAEAERGAIALYGQIIAFARAQHDSATLSLFQRILSDEEQHLRAFTDLVGRD